MNNAFLIELAVVLIRVNDRLNSTIKLDYSYLVSHDTLYFDWNLELSSVTNESSVIELQWPPNPMPRQGSIQDATPDLPKQSFSLMAERLDDELPMTAVDVLIGFFTPSHGTGTLLSAS